MWAISFVLLGTSRSLHACHKHAAIKPSRLSPRDILTFLTILYNSSALSIMILGRPAALPLLRILQQIL